MYSYKLYATVFLVILCNVSTAQWYSQNSNSSARLQSVYFIDQNTGWICGFETVLKTTNSGNNWISSFLSGNLKSIYFLDENKGFICGDNGKLYKTINGGENWSAVGLALTPNLNQITFLNNNTGLIAGNERTILKTTDSGLSWNSLISSNNSLNFYSVKIINSNNYVVSGIESTIYKSSDAGITWDSISMGMPNPLLTVTFVNENTGFASGCCGMFIRTTNAGLNWSTEIYLTLGYSISSMMFINESLGWLAGDLGSIIRTSNSGISWETLNSGTQKDLYSIYFSNSNTGYAVGNTGTILKTTNGGGMGTPIGIKQVSSEIPEDYILFQNYPNPFNPNTVISYQLSVFSFASLKIYDILGNEVATLVNEKQNAGIYSVDFDARLYGQGSNLPSGIYFYKLQTDNFNETKKMSFVK